MIVKKVYVYTNRTGEFKCKKITLKGMMKYLRLLYGDDAEMEGYIEDSWVVTVPYRDRPVGQVERLDYAGPE